MRTLFAILFCAFIASAAFGVESQTQTERILKRLQEREQFLMQEYLAAEAEVDRESLEGRVRKLLDEYESFIKDNPDNVPAIVAYGMLLSQIGERELAFRVFTRANNLDGEIPQVHNQLGNYMIEDGYFEMALGHYLTAIRLAPEEPLYHYQLGNLLFFFQDELVMEEVYSKSELPEMIFESFKQAAHFAPHNFAYQYRFGEAFYDHPNPDLDAALNQWKTALALAEDEREFEMVNLHLANIYAMRGEGDETNRCLEKVNLPEFDAQKQAVENTLKAFYEE